MHSVCIYTAARVGAASGVCKGPVKITRWSSRPRGSHESTRGHHSSRLAFTRAAYRLRASCAAGTARASTSTVSARVAGARVGAAASLWPAEGGNARLLRKALAFPGIRVQRHGQSGVRQRAEGQRPHAPRPGGGCNLPTLHAHPRRAALLIATHAPALSGASPLPTAVARSVRPITSNIDAHFPVDGRAGGGGGGGGGGGDDNAPMPVAPSPVRAVRAKTSADSANSSATASGTR